MEHEVDQLGSKPRKHKKHKKRKAHKKHKAQKAKKHSKSRVHMWKAPHKKKRARKHHTPTKHHLLKHRKHTKKKKPFVVPHKKTPQVFTRKERREIAPLDKGEGRKHQGKKKKHHGAGHVAQKLKAA